jgi:electron transport complex protein RnfB
MSIVLPVVIVMLILGVLFGVGLAVASRAFATAGDPRVESVLHALPQANCGACGFAGCRAYAEAVVDGEKVTLCSAGGAEVAAAIASVMGVDAGTIERKRAVVHCQGGESQARLRCQYDGEQDCRAAQLTSGGPKACVYGCLGLGTCARSCPFSAITMSGEQLPIIDADKCRACGICVRVCPRSLISLLEVRYKTYLGCSSRDSGKAVRNACSVGCITCRACEKKDPNGAIVIQNGLPVLDYEKANGDFSVAVEACPMKCYVVGEDALLAASRAEVSAPRSA